MLNEIKKLNLPMGAWQTLIVKALEPLVGDSCCVVVKCEYPDYRTCTTTIYLDTVRAAAFSLSFLYGCKGVVVSHGMVVAEQFQGRGIATALAPIKVKMAQDLKAAFMLATVLEHNVKERKVIKVWKELLSFINPRTNNSVGLHAIKL